MDRNYWTSRGVGRRRLIVRGSAGAVGLVALGMVGCSSSNTNTKNNPGTVASGSNSGSATAAGTPGAASRGGAASPAAAAAQGTPKRGGTLTLTEALDPQHLDAHTLITPAIVNFYSLASNRLLRFKGGPDVTPTSYDPIPDAAQSLPEQPDPLSYIFKLKPGIKWQNLPPVNGRALEAADYKYSLERIGTNKPEFIYRYLVDAIDKIEATDATTLKITTKAPYGRLVSSMALPMMTAVPHEVVERDGNLQTTMIGTGPFILKQWTPKVGATFVRNPDYFEPDLPYLDQINYTFISDQSARLSAFLSGQTDIIDSTGTVTPDNLQQVKSSLPAAKIIRFSEVGGNQYMFLADKPPFNDLRVRQAWHYAIDRAKHIQVDGAGDADWRSGPLSPGFTDWTRPQKDIQADGALDLKKAKDLLTAAGQGGGFKMKMMAAADTPSEIQWSEWSQQQMKQLGIDVEVQSVPHPAYLSAQVQRSIEPGQVYAIRAYPDPDDYLYPLFFSSGSKNYINVNDPKLDALLTEQRQTLDNAKRKQILQQIDHDWINYAYHVFSYTGNVYLAYQNKVKNFGPTSLTEVTQLRNTWLG